jgi:hypothetical protein
MKKTSAKKKYSAPKMKIAELKQKTSLLAYSDQFGMADQVKDYFA